MKFFITLILCAGILVACSGASSREKTAPAALPLGTPGSVNASEASQTKVPPMETPMNNATSNSNPNGIKVNPPHIPIESTSTPLEGWKTYTSMALGVAVDYPKDWSISENDAAVRFTSPEGQQILLQADKSNGGASTTGQDCATLINSYGQAGNICLDSASSRYTAVFNNPAGESAAWLILSVTSQEKPTVFYQMFDSFRFVQ